MIGGGAGIFIAFEGIDGSGKSTQIIRLINRLKYLGIECHGTKEPTDSPIGSLIRQILTGRLAADNKVVASLFVADRVDHLLNASDGILQKVSSGIDVITDRYYFSSYAYNAVDIDMDWVINANSISADILRPSLTVFLDMPVNKALERIKRDRPQMELFEKEGRLAEVRKNYFKAFGLLRDVEKVEIIDADADADIVEQRIWQTLSKFY